jgi:hypothetical protein
MQGKTQGHQGAQSDRQSGRNGNYSLIISSQIEISLYANQQRLSERHQNSWSFRSPDFPPLSPNESRMLLIKQIGEHNRNYTKQQWVTYPPSSRRPGSRRPPPPTGPPPTTSSTTSSTAPPPTLTSRRCQVDRPNSQPQTAPRRLGLLFSSLPDAGEGFPFLSSFSTVFFSSRGFKNSGSVACGVHSTENCSTATGKGGTRFRRGGILCSNYR